MSGLGGPGLGGGFGKKNSIGSKVGRALGGHLSNAGKLGGSGKKGFNFSGFNFGKFFKNFKPGYAKNMGQVTGKLKQLSEPSAWKVKQFADKNLDITKMNKSFKVDIDTDRAIQGIKNETVRNWLNKYTPKAVKDLKINHQMYSPTKIKPTDPRYNPTGTGSIQLDPDTEKYLEWMARTNPEGATISDYEKLYAKHLAEGISLENAMRFNPAETKSFYALIDDKDSKNTQPNTTTTTKDKMANEFDWKKYGITDARLPGSGLPGGVQHNIDRLYQNIVGRNSDSSGGDYWAKQISSGKNTYDDLVRGLTGSKEYKDRLAAKNANPNITEAELDKLDSAYVSPFHAGSGSNMAGFTPDQTPNDAQAYSVANNYPDQTNQNVGQVNQANNVSGSTGGTGKIGTDAPIPSDPAGGWWTEFDSKDAFKDFLTGGQDKSDGMGDFMKFMMLMSVMGGGRGFGGGGGWGSQYGYGGLNPGGVQAAYNPWANMQDGMKFFKDNFGSGVAGGTTMNATGS